MDEKDGVVHNDDDIDGRIACGWLVLDTLYESLLYSAEGVPDGFLRVFEKVYILRQQSVKVVTEVFSFCNSLFPIVHAEERYLVLFAC